MTDYLDAYAAHESDAPPPVAPTPRRHPCANDDCRAECSLDANGVRMTVCMGCASEPEPERPDATWSEHYHDGEDYTPPESEQWQPAEVVSAQLTAPDGVRVTYRDVPKGEQWTCFECGAPRGTYRCP